MPILLSIKSEYAEKIYAGQKGVEFRKTVPKGDGVFRMYLYETKPVGMITGYADVYGVTTTTNSHNVLWNMTADKAGITKEEFDSYFKNSEKANAYHIKEVVRYGKPISLDQVNIKRAPQSWMYVGGDSGRKSIIINK